VSLEITRKAAARLPVLDRVAERVQPPVQQVLERAPRLRSALDGRWLGAPLHPALTDVPIGAWAVAAMLDAVESEGRGNAADAALAVGTLAALPAATTGLGDWSHLRGEQRRIGVLHAAVNAVALGLNVASLVLRTRGKRGPGRMLSSAAFVAASLSAHVGGQLSFGLGVRVNRTAWQAAAKDAAAVLAEAELEGNELRRVEVDGVPVVVARTSGGEICAIAATCSHLGGPLDEGAREGDAVVCPWHGSKFDLCTGEVIASPAVFRQPRYDVSVGNGKITVRAEGA
jgi:nitrite reductase/ring-hydroxylating ferredoxin subunit